MTHPGGEQAPPGAPPATDPALHTEYRVAHLLEHLAAGHPGELGVRVEVRGEDVLLTGTVTSAQCRDEILGMVREELAGIPVHYDIVVADTSSPDRAEELS